jgi:hypothetical protein
MSVKCLLLKKNLPLSLLLVRRSPASSASAVTPGARGLHSSTSKLNLSAFCR